MTHSLVSSDIHHSENWFPHHQGVHRAFPIEFSSPEAVPAPRRSCGAPSAGSPSWSWRRPRRLGYARGRPARSSAWCMGGGARWRPRRPCGGSDAWRGGWGAEGERRPCGSGGGMRCLWRVEACVVRKWFRGMARWVPVQDLCNMCRFYLRP